MACGENVRFCRQFIQRKGKPVGFPCFVLRKLCYSYVLQKRLKKPKIRIYIVVI